MKFSPRTMLLTLGVACAALGFATGGQSEEVGAIAIQNGEVGLVISSMSFGLGRDEDVGAACPDGMSKGFIDAYAADGGDISLRPNEEDQVYSQRMYRAASHAGPAPTLDGLCVNPTLEADTHFRTVAAVNVASEGVDLDGQASRAHGRAAAGTCAHDDFRSASGARTVDNQMHRVLGCTMGYQNAGASRTLNHSMLQGQWTLLLRLTGVDSLENDADVTVGLYSTVDPIQVSPDRTPLIDATYTADADPRFRAMTHGRIVNGVLTTAPADVHFRWAAEEWRLVRPLKQARLQVRFTPTGAAGFVAGYTPIDEWFENNYNYRAAVQVDGAPAREGYRWYSAIGTANSQGFTCNGLYQAMRRFADGDRDPATGRCSSLSTQYRISAIPAFVIASEN